MQHVEERPDTHCAHVKTLHAKQRVHRILHIVPRVATRMIWMALQSESNTNRELGRAPFSRATRMVVVQNAFIQIPLSTGFVC